MQGTAAPRTTADGAKDFFKYGLAGKSRLILINGWGGAPLPEQCHRALFKQLLAGKVDWEAAKGLFGPHEPCDFPDGVQFLEK
jgi:hypothetical protein